MYVRWKRRQLKKKKWQRDGPDHVRYAVLVKCERVNGKPRQKVIKHLGAIRDYGLPHVGHWKGFWDTADRALAELALDDAQRQAIEGKLLAVVPRPTPAAWKAAWAKVGALARR